MMNLWNNHIQLSKYRGFGIKNMDIIVMEFVTDKKAEILQLNLYTNLVAHLINLHQAGVISLGTILSAVKIIQTFIMSEVSTKSWSAQCSDVSSTSSPGSLRQ